MYIALKGILSKIVPFTVLPIAIYSYQPYSRAPIGSTFVWWLIEALVLIVFIVTYFMFFETENKRHFRIVNAFVIWIVFSIIRGIFMAENYWDYKALVGHVFDLLILIVAYTASNKERLQGILSFFIKFALPFALLAILYQGPFNAKGNFLYPVSLLVLFLPGLKIQWKAILLIITLIVIVDGIVTSARSLTIISGIPVLLLGLYYFRFFIAYDKIIKAVHAVFMIAPWIFFFLGVSGIFNVFHINEYIKVNYVTKTFTQDGRIHNQAITEDSRTFIYREVLQSAKKYNYWILGRSPARGNETVVFASFFEKISGRNERYRNEANVTNMLTWMGIVGLLLYFLIFYKASSLAIYQSNNIYIKLIGLYVAFRWSNAWLDDFASFNINNFTIWSMIGICLSESFRKMNNLEVMLWARGIFEKRYIRYLDYLEKKVSQKYVKIKPG